MLRWTLLKRILHLYGWIDAIKIAFFELSSLPSSSKWRPQQSCCFLCLHHLAQFYHHWQPACKLQGQVCIKQIISGRQQIMWGSDANLFTAFFPNTLKVLLCCIFWWHVIKQRVCVCDVCVLEGDWKAQKKKWLNKSLFIHVPFNCD